MRNDFACWLHSNSKNKMSRPLNSKKDLERCKSHIKRAKTAKSKIIQCPVDWDRIFSAPVDARDQLESEAFEECGRHSGIRQCCRDYFNSTWTRMSQAERSRQIRKQTRILRKRGIAEMGYIPCEECLKHGKRIKLKRCTCNEEFCLARDKAGENIGVV